MISGLPSYPFIGARYPTSDPVVSELMYTEVLLRTQKRGQTEFPSKSHKRHPEIPLRKQTIGIRSYLRAQDVRTDKTKNKKGEVAGFHRSEDESPSTADIRYTEGYLRAQKRSGPVLISEGISLRQLYEVVSCDRKEIRYSK